ncbi:MAG: dihydrodipicolinate reductase [Thermoproteota archaeon]
MPVKVAVYGLGPIGMLIARKVLERKDLELVAAFETDPSKIGRDVGELIDIGERIGLIVSRDSEATGILRRSGADVVLHATSSFLDKIYPQIVKCVEAGADLISTSETLANPWYRYPQLASEIDRMARENNVSIIGAGVNPGFVFDALPILMTLVCTRIDCLRVTRSLDAGKRRFSFQKKYGLALSIDEFKRKMESGEITAHVGYGESVGLIANALRVNLTRIVEKQEPIVSQKPLKTQYFEIMPGRVAGVHGYGIGYVGEKELIRVELLAEAGREEFEEVIIEGEPCVKWRSSGIAGDTATAAVIINLIPKVLEARPGLLRITDIPLPSAFLTLKTD